MKRSRFLLLLFLFAFTVKAKTIAISYFDNSSGDAKFNALSKGIADMLITDLSKVKGISIVEREKLEKLLQEIKLEQSKYFDPNTAQKLGKGLGAQNILTGSFYILDNTLRIDARLIDVQTGGIVLAEQVTGNKNNFFALHAQLAGLLAKNLNVPYSPDMSGLYKTNEQVELTAVVNYSKAIELQDQGLDEAAEQILEKTIKTYPKFHFAKNKLDEVKELIKQVEQQREKLIAEELKNTLNNLDPKSDKFGTQLTTVWGTLLSSYKYTQLLSFNNTLRGMKLDEKKKLFGEASPMTLGEMMLFYDCTALNALKRYDEVVESSKLFITTYPTSMYFQGIKIGLEQAIKELEQRENGKKGLDVKLGAEALDAYINYLNKLQWKSNVQFVDEKEYRRYRELYQAQVLSASKEVVAAWDESIKFSEFTEFFEVAERFRDFKTMEEIVSTCKKVFTEPDDEERVLSLENKLADIKTKELEEAEKIKELESIAKKGSEEELGKVVKWLFSNEKYNRPDLLLQICEKYISMAKPGNEKNNDLLLSAWDGLITHTATQKSVEEAKKLFESFKGKAADFKASVADYDKTVREINLDLKNLQNDYNGYLKNLKEKDPMSGVLENYAKIYNESHQYTEEVFARKQLLDLVKGDADKESLQLFMLAMCYYNMGYFENTQRTADRLKEKYPTSTYTESVNSIVSFMPR